LEEIRNIPDSLQLGLQVLFLFWSHITLTAAHSHKQN
jgi:hypothetical protein